MKRTAACTGLGELGPIKTALQRRRSEAAEHETELRAKQDQEQSARELFSRSVGSVTALGHSGRTELRAPKPAPEPLQRQRDEAAALRETLAESFDVDSLLETDATLSFRRRDIGRDVVGKLRRGGWVIQAQIDLHGLRRDEARDRLVAFLGEATRLGLRCVRVIHGKGNGSPGREPVLKHRVQDWLARQSAVLAYTQARAADGGGGALIVLLQSKTRV